MVQLINCIYQIWGKKHPYCIFSQLILCLLQVLVTDKGFATYNIKTKRIELYYKDTPTVASRDITLSFKEMFTVYFLGTKHQRENQVVNICGEATMKVAVAPVSTDHQQRW